MRDEEWETTLPIHFAEAMKREGFTEDEINTALRLHDQATLDATADWLRETDDEPKSKWRERTGVAALAGVPVLAWLMLHGFGWRALILGLMLCGCVGWRAWTLRCR